MREHQQALQEIADANGNTRTVLTPGYDASVDYVVEQLTDAGWEVEVQEFTFPEYPGELEQLTPPVGRLVHRRRGPQDRGAAVLTYAYSTEDVNGVPGRAVPGRFTIPAPAGPEGTFQES